MQSWHLVLPVKHGPESKSRLLPPAGLARGELARALALDTIMTASRTDSVGQVTVVTSESVVSDHAARWGCRVVPDPGSGLNDAIRAGLGEANGPRAVLLADLPALTPADLHEALAACGQYARAVVPDAAGTGTVLLTATDEGQIEPAFGVDSAARHALAPTHAQRLELALPRLRHDVDTRTDLERLSQWEAGPHTQALLLEATRAAEQSAAEQSLG